jgi:hypothetical protein
MTISKIIQAKAHTHAVRLASPDKRALKAVSVDGWLPGICWSLNVGDLCESSYGSHQLILFFSLDNPRLAFVPVSPVRVVLPSMTNGVTYLLLS